MIPQQSGKIKFCVMKFANIFLMGKEDACNAGDPWFNPQVQGRSPGEGNGIPLQYSCLENSMDEGAWWTTVHGVAKSLTTERLHFHHPISFIS